MLYAARLLICLFMLFSLSSCGFLRSLAFSIAPPFAEPTEGPRAKLRVVYQGALTRFYPGDTCFNSENPDAALAGPYAGFVRPAKRLGMPLEPKEEKFDEFYVKANEPMAVSFYYESETLVRPDQKLVRICGPVGFTFTPTQDEMYEARFEWISDRLCGYELDIIIKDTEGNFKKQRVPAGPTSSCQKKKDGASINIPPATSESERRYY